MSNKDFKDYIDRIDPRLWNNFAMYTCYKKQKYGDMYLAKRAAEKRDMSVYKCPICYLYHLTSLTLEEFYQRMSRFLKRLDETEP